MQYFTLPIFPVESTAAAVTVAVWIGVCVVVFFNLRFGWTLSGLVVPGYLVPLLLVKPLSVSIIVVEAIATYLIVRLLSDGWGRIPWWSSFFGRDRFFVLVLVSILVRAFADGWFLPLVGQWLNDAHQLRIDYRNDLHSYGLIVVSLLANYFWKPRLVNGFLTSAACVALSYVILRFGVMNLTNFSLGSLQYMYEDVSASLLASPKAYVLVISTAYVASWANLKFSWDFNGILIPALLGLLWHNPAKIFVTCVEAVWILALATQILRLPYFQRMTVEGGRKLLLFFTVAALHRLLVAHLLPLFTDQQVTDAFGFGYLLTTLMAMKSHDKKITLRVFRATIQTSMVGAVIGSVLGFGLSYLPTDLLGRSVTISAGSAEWQEVEDRTVWDLLSEQRVRLYMTRVPGSFQPPLPTELSTFHQSLDELLGYAESSDVDQFRRAVAGFNAVNYNVSLFAGRYVVLHERNAAPSALASSTSELAAANDQTGADSLGILSVFRSSNPNSQRGWGIYVVDLDSPSEMLVEVPAPLEEWSTFDAGFVLFTKLGARALAISGTARETNSDRSSDMLTQRSTIMAAFHSVVGKHDVLQVRGWTPRLVTASGHLKEAQASQVGSHLFVKNAMPPSLKLAELEQFISGCEVAWQTTSVPNTLRDQTSRGFAELVLSEADLRRLKNRAGLDARAEASQMARLDGTLNRWLQDERELLARQGSNSYRAASVDEMLYLDEEVVGPLIQVARSANSFDKLTDANRERLATIDTAAHPLGYGLVLFHDTATDDDYFVLREELPRQRHWGTYVFRAGLESPYVVEVPRPLYEQQTFQFGISLFEHPRSSVLMIAGAHPFANPNGTADVMRLANKVCLFHLVRQVLLREFPVEPMLLMQSRAIQAPIDADVVIGTDDGTSSYEQSGPLVRGVVDQFKADNRRVRLVDGSELTAGYELGILLQASSLLHSENKQMVSLWISPALRRKYRDSRTLTMAAAQFSSIGIESVEMELFD
ncbi:MAG: hypothetical protein KDA92_16580, partial [Planctomycetales bacterium]|nr:hypothetical protein [Planctomycetales bacterium]